MQNGGGGPRGTLAVWSAELSRQWLYVDFQHPGPHSALAVWTRYSQDGVDCRVRAPHNSDHTQPGRGCCAAPRGVRARVGARVDCTRAF